MGNKQDLPAKRFVESISKDEIKDISSDTLEAFLDAKLEDGFFKDLPVVGWAFKTLSMFQKTKDYFFAKKLLKFLNALKDTTKEEREKLLKKTEQDGGAQEVGEKVLFLLSQADEIEKGTVYGKLFSAYTKGDISVENLHRAMTSVNKVFLSDLSELTMCCREEKMIRDALSTEVRAGFLNAGLIAIDGTDEGTMDGSAKVKYVCTDTGRIISQYGI